MNPAEPPSPTADLLTAGQMAANLKRSRYGVKKAIQRLGIDPKLMLGGISYYEPAIEKTVAEAMRGPNLQTPAKD
jgi:hypothetical protein